MNSADQLADARAALAHGADAKALDLAWRAASAAARVDNKDVLAEVVEFAKVLPGAEQVRAYAEAALEDARKGTRPPSAFERLISRAKRPR